MLVTASLAFLSAPGKAFQVKARVEGCCDSLWKLLFQPGPGALGLPEGFAAAGMCSAMLLVFSGSNFELVNLACLLKPDKPILLSTKLLEDFVFALGAVTVSAWSSGDASPLCCLQCVAVCFPSTKQTDRFPPCSSGVFSPLAAAGAIVLSVVCPLGHNRDDGAEPSQIASSFLLNSYGKDNSFFLLYLQ